MSNIEQSLINDAVHNEYLARPADDTDDACVITSCKACYFAKRKRIMPAGCNDMLCSDWRDRSCLYKWARCVEGNDKEKQVKMLKNSTVILNILLYYFRKSH